MRNLAPYLLPLSLLLAGCPPSPYRLGVKAANDGQFYEASKLWIGALDDDIYQTKPRQALAEYGPLAFEQRRALAQEHEASGRYEEAVEVYEDLLDFAKELDSVEQLSFSTDEVQAELVDTRAAWSVSEFEAAAAADEEGDWEAARVHFDKVRELAPEFEGLDTKQGFSYLLWAEEDLAKYRYEGAAEHFRASYELTGNLREQEWASAVDVALGRYALSRDKCRTAVEYFDRAGDVLGDRELESDREQAMSCARIGIVMEPITEEVEFRQGETALASMLVDRIEQQIDANGSRYIRLLAAETLDQVEDAPAHRIQVKGRITQAVVEEPAVTEEKRTTEGRMLVDCDKETLLYEPDAVCTDPVEVEYTHHRTAVIVRMAGSVKIIDLGSGEQKTRPLDITLSNDTTHATDFQVFQEGTWVPTHIGPEADLGRVEVADEVRALDRKPLPLPPESQLVGDAIDVLAEVAAEAVLEVVDHEDPPPPPKRLQIREPLLLPADLGFKAPELPEPVSGDAAMKAEPIGGPAKPVRWSPAWRAADRKLQRAELEGALSAEDSPADLPTLLHLAELMLWEDPGAFEGMVERAEALAPDDPTAAVLRIALRSRMGLHDAAEERFLAWLDAHPGDGLAWKYYGLLLADQKRPAARQALENAQRLGYEDDYMKNNLEMVYSLETAAPQPAEPAEPESP